MRRQLGLLIGVLAVIVAAVTGSQLVARQVEPTRTAEERPKFDLSRLDRWISPEDRYVAHGYEADRNDKWEVVIDDVPFNRWLVLTDISIGRSMAAVLVSLEGKERRVLFDTTPYRDHKGPWTEQQSEFISYHSATGLVLAPGSKLIIRNSGVGNADIGWHLTGYLFDVE